MRAKSEAVRVAGSAAAVWIVVTAKPGQEILAKEELEAKGFEIYLPMKLIETKRHELVARPFFPRYLFARITLQVERWKCIFSTRGVAGVLTQGATPHGVRDEVIKRIKDQEDGGYIRMGLEDNFKRGQRFRLDDLGLEGVFEERVDAKRALILVSLLQRDSRVKVDLSRLTPL